MYRLTLTLFLSLFLSLPAWAQPSVAVPNLVDVQGFLRTQNGQPVNKTVSLKVTLYDASSGGNQLYTETIPLVPVTGGRFSVQLGTTKPIPPDLFTTNAKVFVAVSVDSSPELPRQQLATVAFSYKAQVAVNAVSADTASGLDCTGCVAEANIGDASVTGPKIGVPCDNGQVLKKTSGGWGCGKDDDTKYSGADFAKSNQACGPGLVVSGVDATGTLSCLKIESVSYAAGPGLTLDQNKFLLDLGFTDARYVNAGEPNSVTKDMIADGAVTGPKLGFQCTKDQILKVGDAGWACAKDEGLVYTGKDFVPSNQVCPAGNVVQGAKADGTIVCVKDDGVTYQNGTGLSLAQTTFSLDLTYTDGRYVNAGEAASITKDMVAEGAITAAKIGEACQDKQILKRVGTAWACAKDEVNVYGGNDFVLSNQTCALGQVVKGANPDGTIICGKDDVVLYTAGTGLKLDQTQFLLDTAYTDGRYVKRGEASVITKDMIADGAVTAAKIGEPCGTGEVLQKGAGGWGCVKLTDADTLGKLSCKADEVAKFNGTGWECAQIVLAPPKCNGAFQALQWDGSAWKCVAVTKTGASGGNAKGFEATDTWGFVWDGLERQAATWSVANAQCTALGARLPTITELYRVSGSTSNPAGTSEVGTTYETNYLWALTPWDIGNHGIVRLTDGSVTGSGDGTARAFRCVWSNNTLGYFAGNHCYGPKGGECFQTKAEGKRYNIDVYERPSVTYVAAVDECNFYHAHLAFSQDFAENVPTPNGLPNGSNNWVWTSDSTRYDINDLVKWSGQTTSYTGYGGDYVTWAGRSGNTYRFRCVGVNYGAGAHPNAVTDEFVHTETYLKSENTDRTKFQWYLATKTCFDIGGHLPMEREWTDLIRNGLPNGKGSSYWYWTADNSRYDLTQIIVWNNIDTNFTDYHSTYSTWADRSTGNLYGYRCIWYPLDQQYAGPTNAKCISNTDCYATSKGGNVKAKVWADNFDRSPANWISAVQNCYNAGGHLASARDMTELVQDGLANGSNTWLWTSDGVGDSGYNVLMMKWNGVDKNFNGTYSTYATSSDKSTGTARPYRCVWSNELR